MHRKPLLDLLAAHRPHDPLEAEHLQRMRTFIMGHPDCFSRELSQGHMTGSAWIVDPERTRVLLVHHVKLDRWLQPGGHADGETDLPAVARREACEETGLSSLVPLIPGIFDVDVHAIPARGTLPQHMHYDVRFLFEADPSAMLTISQESHAAAWRPLAEVARAEASLARMARKVLS